MLLHEDVTNLILKAFYQVYRELGYGFLEGVYEAALEMTASELGLRIRRQLPIEVFYRGQVIGEYEADMLINDLVLLELKAARVLVERHEAQLLNYLRATKFEVGLLLNFGPKPQYKRFVFENNRKSGTQNNAE